MTAALDGPDCPPWVPPDDGITSSTNVGAIVGGVVGGVAGGILLAIVGVAATRWNRRRKQRMSPFIAEANSTVKPANDDLSNYNTVRGRGVCGVREGGWGAWQRGGTWAAG